MIEVGRHADPFPALLTTSAAKATLYSVDTYFAEAWTNVRSVLICEQISSTEHRSAWSIALKGAILKWVEHDVIDHPTMVMSFSQVSGDLSMFEGHWRLVERSPELTEVSFEVVFEIGIPLLAEMLNPSGDTVSAR